MSSSEIVVRNYKENAVVYKDPSLIKQNMTKFLTKINLPKGLLPLDDDLLEFGYHEAAGFIWVKRNSKKEHLYKNIRRTVSYDVEFTAFVEDRRLKKITGVKSKEMLFWVPIADIVIDEKDPKMIAFASPAGLSRLFPVSAFEFNNEEENNNNSNGNGKEVEIKKV